MTRRQVKILHQIYQHAKTLLGKPFPLAEKQSNPIPGLLHKYHGRVLMIISGACGVNCRYCFRRHFPYTDNNPGGTGWEQALAYIANDTSITEVIFSGGDPLAASDRRLADLTQAIAAIPHIKTLRIHTRMPIVIPDRVTPELIQWLTGTHLRPVLVTHCNHPQELDTQVAMAIHRLRDAKVTLLNQTVLLRGVNDTVKTLIELSERLFDHGILPYYLHLLDKVQGAAHFDVPLSQAKPLIAGMMAHLPGYLVPRLVQELPGANSKVPVSCL